MIKLAELNEGRAMALLWGPCSDFNLAHLRMASKCQNWEEQDLSRALELLPP